MTKLQRSDSMEQGDAYVLHDVIINQLNQHVERVRVIVE